MPRLAEISPALLQLSPDAQPIPDDITNGQLITALALDRGSLRVCRTRHAALVQSIEARDKIQGGK